ncbi:MAG: KEOPS complex subunit Pcc1 [archaeon]
MSEFAFEFVLKLESKKTNFKTVLESIKPETNNKHEKRSIIKFKKLEQGIILNIKALDLTALRAAVNSYLRLINVSIKMQEVE